MHRNKHTTDLLAGLERETRELPFQPARTEVPAGMKPLAMALELQSPTSLLGVMTTLARLGCRLTYVSAVGQEAALGILVPSQVAHRVLPCLHQVIEVLSVSEVPHLWSPATTKAC